MCTQSDLPLKSHIILSILARTFFLRLFFYWKIFIKKISPKKQERFSSRVLLQFSNSKLVIGWIQRDFPELEVMSRLRQSNQIFRKMSLEVKSRELILIQRRKVPLSRNPSLRAWTSSRNRSSLKNQKRIYSYNGSSGRRLKRPGIS